jgi:hypothetical protein
MDAGGRAKPGAFAEKDRMRAVFALLALTPALSRGEREERENNRL